MQMITSMVVKTITLMLLSADFAFSWIPKSTIHRSSLQTSLSMKVEQLSFASVTDYVAYLKTVSQLPKGFSVAATRFPFTPYEVAGKTLPMNLTLIALDKPTESFAVTFTANKFPGGPVLVGKDRLKQSKELQAIIINNKISNVCPGGGLGDGGYQDSDSICEAVSKAIGLSSKQAVIPSSTGIIGWRLPVPSIIAAIPQLLETRQSDSILPAALGIMTTDRYPKVRSYHSKTGSWSLVGIAKGAGMIEPNMATMLSYLLTDLSIPRKELQQMLSATVPHTFNSISVDGDQSTSDTAVLISSKVFPSDEKSKKEFAAALSEVCGALAEDIVRNGEGTQHVIKVSVLGLQDKVAARKIGKAIVNSNLVKCAISGCDPNVGRIVGAIGSFLGNVLPDSDIPTFNMRVVLGGKEIFSKGAFQLDPAAEKFLSDYLFDCQLYPKTVPEHDRLYPSHSKSVELVVDFDPKGSKDREAVVVIGSDLTEEYVEVNADYRS